MSNIPYKDASGNTRYLKNSTAGTDLDPDSPRIYATPVSKSGDTGGSANTWIQIVASNTSRLTLFVQNPPNNASNIDIGWGSSGSELLMATLQPGDSLTIGNSSFSIASRIAARSTGVSIPFIAWEA